MKPKAQQNLLYILIPSFIVIIIWLISNIYNHAVMTTITTDQAVSIKPISESFDARVIDSLKKRRLVIGDTTAKPVIAPSPTPELKTPPDASESGTGGLQ